MRELSGLLDEKPNDYTEYQRVTFAEAMPAEEEAAASKRRSRSKKRQTRPPERFSFFEKEDKIDF